MTNSSVVATAYDFESGRLNPDWGQYTIRLRSLNRAYPSLHPFGVVHWVPEQLNIKAVTGHASWMQPKNLCSTTPYTWHHLAYATEIKSTQLHATPL